MVKKGKMLPVRLDAWDRDLVESLASSMRGSEAQVIRWALRFYAVNGPWAEKDRGKVLKRHKQRLFDVGPNLVEV